jgi:hypothetical protein
MLVQTLQVEACLDVDLSAVQKTWDVNLMGPLMWTREAVKAGLKESVLECLFCWRNKTITLHGGLQYFKSWINLYDKAISNGACT